MWQLLPTHGRPDYFAVSQSPTESAAAFDRLFTSDGLPGLPPRLQALVEATANEQQARRAHTKGEYLCRLPNTFHLLRSPSISIISPSHIPPRISLPRISGEYYRFLERPTRRNLWITAAPKVSALHYDADDR